MNRAEAKLIREIIPLAISPLPTKYANCATTVNTVINRIYLVAWNIGFNISFTDPKERRHFRSIIREFGFKTDEIFIGCALTMNTTEQIAKIIQRRRTIDIALKDMKHDTIRA